MCYHTQGDANANILLAVGRALAASGSLAMTTPRRSWSRGPRYQRGWGVTQKTQAMMLSRTVTGSLAAEHKKGAKGHRGPWARRIALLCDEWCRR